MGSLSLPFDGHHLFDKLNRPDFADLHENILVIQSLFIRVPSMDRQKVCEPKDFLKFASELKGDLFDSTSSKAMERFNTLTIKLTSLQKNYENNHLRYK